MTMRIGVLGMATVDTLLSADVPAYRHDAVTLLNRVTSGIGGKGMVTAIAAHHGGADVAPCALVGRRSSIAAEVTPIFPTHFLLPALQDDHRIWIVISGEHEVVTFVHATVPPRGRLAAIEADATSFTEAVDVLYVSMEHPALVETGVRTAAARGIPVVINLCEPLLSGLTSAVPELVRRSSAILCNEAESRSALATLGAAAWSNVDAPELREVVITGGAAGGRWSCRPFDRWARYEACPTRIACVVGAGDTFNGAYLASRFVHGQPPDEACRAAAERAAEKIALFASSLPVRTLFGRLHSGDRGAE